MLLKFSLEMRSNSLTPDKKTRRQTISAEIPSILKRNIAALSESSESIKLTDFGKSFIDDDKTPPKKKKKSLFDKLVCDDSKNIEIVSTENKRLKSVKAETVRQAMISSPSLFEIKPKKTPSSPIQKFPSTNFVHKAEAPKDDDFDKLKRLENQLNDSKANSKGEEEVIIKDSSKDEKSSKDKNKKEHLVEEKSVTESSSSSSHSVIKIDGKIIKDFRDSLNGFRQMLSGIKSIK